MTMHEPWQRMRLVGNPALAWHVMRGRGPAPQSPGLVLLHGVTRCGRDFEPLVAALAAAPGQASAPDGARSLTFPLAVVDQRGHGDSGRATGYLVTDYATDAARLIRESGPCVVVGHSLGAMVAAQAAAELPELVRGAVLVDPPFHAMGRRIAGSSWEALFVGLRDAARQGGSVPELANAIADIRLPAGAARVRLGDIRDPAALRWHAECLARLDPDVLTPVIEGRWLDGYDPPVIAAKIRCPLVLMQADPACGGALDDADADAFTTAAPSCRIERVRGTGHALHREQPQRVAAVVHELHARLR